MLDPTKMIALQGVNLEIPNSGRADGTYEGDRTGLYQILAD